MIFSKNKGFTLIELLVVIALIGLLASVVLVSLKEVRAKARDARRKQDLETIRKALELSYDKRGYYPGDGPCDDKSNCDPDTGWRTDSYIWKYLVTEDNLLPYLPKDPINDSEYYYYYEPNSYNQGNCNEPSWARACEFVLRAKLETGGYWYNDSFGVGKR